MITTPIRFFHKDAGLREDACKCVLFFTDCHYVCNDVSEHTGSFVYFKKVQDENR